MLCSSPVLPQYLSDSTHHDDSPLLSPSLLLLLPHLGRVHHFLGDLSLLTEEPALSGFSLL